MSQHPGMINLDDISFNSSRYEVENKNGFDPSQNIYNTYLLPIFEASIQNSNDTITDHSNNNLVIKRLVDPIIVTYTDISLNVNIVSHETKEKIESTSKENQFKTIQNYFNNMNSMLNSKKKVMMNDNANR